MQSDKEKYLEFWGYKLGTPEADEAWRLKCEHTNRQAPAVFGDLPGYDSPVTGKWVEGRAARREDLRRNGCIPYDPEMKKDAARTRAELERKADAKLEHAAARAFYQMPESKRRLLSRG
ncbi:MAG TPA: hypothetical protein VN081_06890 [Dongiaceae bacterium]|nr:hypothetical protein [Dongiaceae bacterium]